MLNETGIYIYVSRVQVCILYIFTYVYLYVFIYTQVSMYIYIYSHMYMYASMYIYIRLISCIMYTYIIYYDIHIRLFSQGHSQNLSQFFKLPLWGFLRPLRVLAGSSDDEVSVHSNQPVDHVTWEINLRNSHVHPAKLQVLDDFFLCPMDPWLGQKNPIADQARHWCWICWQI